MGTNCIRKRPASERGEKKYHEKSEGGGRKSVEKGGDADVKLYRGSEVLERSVQFKEQCSQSLLKVSWIMQSVQTPG